jgi:hypothetical protein
VVFRSFKTLCGTVFQLVRSRLVGNVERTGEMRNAYKILVGKSEGKSPCGRPRRRWEPNNVRTDVREVVWEGVDRIHLAQDREK